MKRLIVTGWFTLASIIPALNAQAEEASDNPLANTPTQYSADVVVTRKAGQPISMRVYVDGNKRRIDRDLGGGTIVILRGDLSKRYILMTNTKTYVEGALDPKALEPATDWAKRMGIVHEKVGTEDVNGELCDKYRFSSDPGKALNAKDRPMVPGPRPMGGLIWVGQTTHMLVKSENAGSTAEWKNIKVGPPDGSLFEIPADYKKLEPGKPAQVKPEEQNSGGQKSADPSPTGEQKSGNSTPSGEKTDGQ
jgi:hypothetical protein